MKIAFLVSLLTIILSLPTAAPAEVSPPILSFAGKTVRQVSYEGLEFPQSEFDALVPITVGKVLRPPDIRDGIKNLYRTGLFDRIVVLGKTLPDGVLVLFRMFPRKWLKEVRFEGNLHIPSNSLLRKMDLGREEEITPARLEENRSKIEKYYSYRGFMDIKTAYRTEVGPKQKTNVIYRIMEGPKYRITDVRLRGDPGMSRFKVLSLTASMPGETMDGVVLDRDVVRIVDHLKDKGYYYPEVSYSIQPDPRVKDGVVVTYKIVRGDRFKLLVTIDRPDQKIKPFLKIVKRSFAEEDGPGPAKERAAKEVMKKVLGDGFPLASVRWIDRTPAPGEREITLDVTAGLKAVFGTLTIDGVESLTLEKVRDSLGFAEGEPFVRSRLDSGVKELKRAYRDQGYLDAEVTLKPLSFSQAQDPMTSPVHILVDEGPQTLVGMVTIKNSPYSPDETRRIVGIHVGTPYVPEKVDAGRGALLDRLGLDGYVYASVTAEDAVPRKNGTMDVILDVAAGPQVHLGSLIVLGTDKVNNRIIRRALGLKRGDLLTTERLIEAQQRVYDLNVFATVDIGFADEQIPAPVKDVIVKVSERARYAIGIKVGFGSEDRFRTQLSVTNRNVSGMARSLTLSLRRSSVEHLESLVYRHPYFLGKSMDFTSSLSDFREENGSFSEDTRSISLKLKREITQKITGIAEYSFKGQDIFNISPGVVLSPQDQGSTKVASVVLEGIYESRDDILNPTGGTLGQVRLNVASRYLGSEAEDYGCEISVHRYFSLGSGVVLAGLARGGIVHSFGNSDQVIIGQRFFLGGMTSIRGYKLDNLGPKDADGNPVGGNYMVNLNTELRYPVYRSIGGVLFVDSGAVWLNEAPFDDSTLRASAGMGIRLSTPAGPLSLDYGYKLNPATAGESRYRVHFSIGHAF
ncbi:MAG: BamA/TamA family outer membrane protein [Deltaproteobacteria bacterium]|nr:BamA/TamA family outer membrane protein [Deltaproteobacteria bacterium]